MANDRTIWRLWRNGVAAKHPGPAYLTETPDGWREVSWEEAAERVQQYANGLLARGIRKGDAFGILARTTIEWALFDYALAHVGAVGAAIYANNSPKDVHYVLEHSESVGVLCEDDDQRAKVEAGRDRLPALEHVLTFVDLPALAAEGVSFAAEHPNALDERLAEIDEEDIFTFIYTSGTTGPPKACMIRNRNYAEMVRISRSVELTAPGDTLLLFLPLAHNYGRLLHLLAPYVGFTIAFVPEPLAVAAALQEVKPTVLPSVPRVYEKVHTAMVARFDEATGVKHSLIEWAQGIGRRVSVLEQAGATVPRSLRLRWNVADRLVYRKVREGFGGRLRGAFSGGAPLSREIIEFFDALGLRILEGYGLTECTTGATANRLDSFRFGSVGRALPDVELRLDDDGELLIRSPTVFAGYYKDPDASAAVLGADGWLRTGDIAEIDPDGFVTITDRKKDIIVTAGGKNIAPQNLENDLKTSKYVSQALVVGDRRPYPAALITLDQAELAKWAVENGLDGDAAGLADDVRIRQLVQGVVDEVNRERSRYEQLKRFSVLPRDFTIEGGELTPTLKVRRRVVLERYADEIEQLYAGDTSPAPAN
jgi:long-chain acyl-CoA synthetase